MDIWHHGSSVPQLSHATMLSRNANDLTWTAEVDTVWDAPLLKAGHQQQMAGVCSVDGAGCCLLAMSSSRVARLVCSLLAFAPQRQSIQHGLQ